MAPPTDAGPPRVLRGVRPDSLLGQALRGELQLDPVVRVRPDAEEAAPSARRSRLRSALLGLGIGVGVGVAGIAIAFSVIAIPLYLLASTEPGSGLDRDLVRKGLFFVALPFGALVGTAIGAVVGIWYGRGGRLPSARSSIHGR